MDSYQRMRSIGVSVETADALSSAIDALPHKAREAVFLKAQGYRDYEICATLKISKGSLWRIIRFTRGIYL